MQVLMGQQASNEVSTSSLECTTLQGSAAMAAEGNLTQAAEGLLADNTIDWQARPQYMIEWDQKAPASLTLTILHSVTDLASQILG